MNQDLALIPQLISAKSDKALYNISSVLAGVFLLALLARISVPLPFTPVPITGQTFGVALVALLWGRYRGFAVTGSYLLVGALGIPAFANGSTGLALGPTSGYLGGMLLASFLVGSLADHGWTQSYFKAFAAAVMGSVVVFSCGLLILSFFLNGESLWMAGLLPFLPGDFLKNSLAAWMAWRSTVACEK